MLLIYPDHKPDPLLYGESEGLERCFSNCEPLGLEYIAAGILDICDNVDIVDLRFEKENLQQLLQQSTPDVVGISGYSMHVPRILNILREIKRTYPQIKTVVGGIHASLMAEDFFVDEVDYIVKGSKISTFKSLIISLSENKTCENIPDIYTSKESVFRLNAAEESIQEEAKILPRRSLTERVRGNYQMLGMKPIALMRTSYGCPYRCSFCSLWGLNQGKYHLHEMEEVLEDIDSIQEENIHFVDDEPWLKPERMKTLAQRIIKAGIKKNYLLYARIDTLINRKDILEKWMEAGLKKVLIGVEAITAKELEGYGKKISLSQIEQSYKVTESMGLDSVSLFIVRPDYQEKDFKRLKRFILRNRVPNPMFTILTPLPGTAMLTEDFSGVKSITANGRPDWYQWDLQHPVTETQMPREKFIEEYISLRSINV